MSFRSILVTLRFVAALAGLLLLLLSSPARATTMVRMSDEALTLGADAIVTGTVTDVSRRARPATAAIATLVTIAIDGRHQRISARRPPSPLREARAAASATTSCISIGAPHTTVGESVIAFLGQDGDGFLRTSQMALGKFSVTSDPESGARIANRALDEEGVIVLGAARAAEPSRRRPAPRRPLSSRALRDIVRAPAGTRARCSRSPSIARRRGRSADATGRREGYKLFNNVRWFLPDDGMPGALLSIDQARATRSSASTRARTRQRRLRRLDRTCRPRSLVMQSARQRRRAPPNGPATAPARSSSTTSSNEVTDPSGCGGILAIGGYCASGASKTVQRAVAFREIVEGDIIFNNGWSGCSFWNATNLAEVATHEIGHTIGPRRTPPTRARRCTRSRTSTVAAPVSPTTTARASRTSIPATAERHARPDARRHAADADAAGRATPTASPTPRRQLPGRRRTTSRRTSTATAAGDACDNCAGVIANADQHAGRRLRPTFRSRRMRIAHRQGPRSEDSITVKRPLRPPTVARAMSRRRRSRAHHDARRRSTATQLMQVGRAGAELEDQPQRHQPLVRGQDRASCSAASRASRCTRATALTTRSPSPPSTSTSTGAASASSVLVDRASPTSGT